MRVRITAALLVALLHWNCAAAAQAPAAPENNAAIAVSGNRHTDAVMIRSRFHAGRHGEFASTELDAALKQLYATGLFADVKISRDGDRILVAVVENPTLQRIAFEGNKKIKDEDLKKVMASRQGGPLSRPTVHDDVEHMIELYRQHGYFDARIDPKTIKGKKDRVDLVFEIKEGDKLAVRRVQFTGNAAYPANKLKGVVKTGETNFLSFLLDNDAYDADRIENDRGLLRHFYLTHGYADVRVRSVASYEAADKGVVVTFAIEEGPQYRYGRIDLQSAVKTVDTSALRASVHTQTGGIYDPDAVNKTVEDATMALAKNGAPFATVLARSDRVPERRLINLVYAIEAGKHAYVERIDIHGNSKTRDEVVRREFDLVEGDPYNRALLDRGERHLKALGDFKSVKITTHPGSAPDRVVVDVAVEEQSTGDFTISGGYSTSAGVLAEVSIGDKNFLGSGDAVKASLTYGEYARGFDLGFSEPYLFGQRLSLGADLFRNETLANTNQSYDSTTYGAKLALGTPINDELGMEWRYSIYNQGLSLDPSVGTATLPIQQAAAAGPIWVSSIGTGVTYSTLDNARNPTDGVRAVFNTDLAGLGGAAKFVRTSDDVRYYHEIAGDLVGMVRAQGGYVTPWGGQQLPLLDGFFGGPQLVRGFAPNGFGPRDLTPGTTQDNIGGNVYWTTSAELQAPMPFVTADAQLKVALFADAGSLWANGASSAASLASLSPSQQIANTRAVRASLGTSLIWNSPFGALRVDYAYPVAKQSYDVTQRLNFTAGAF